MVNDVIGEDVNDKQFAAAFEYQRGERNEVMILDKGRVSFHNNSVKFLVST